MSTYSGDMMEDRMPEGMPSDTRSTMNPEGIFAIRFTEEHRGGGEELSISMWDIYQESTNLARELDCVYNLNIYEDGFTIINCSLNFPSGGRGKSRKVYRGETLESALRKASADGMYDQTWINILNSIRKGLTEYRSWITTLEEAATAPHPLDEDTPDRKKRLQDKA